MKKQKWLSVLLSLAMVLTAIPFYAADFAPKAQAYGTYGKPYATEYYYASNQTFIEALCVGYDSSSASTVKNQMTGAGWTPVSNFLDMMQSWSGSKNIYVGYKTTTNPANALTDIEFFDSDDAHSNYDWHGKNSGWANKNTGTDTCNGVSATGVKDKNTGIVFFRSGGSPLTAYSRDGIVDFLMGMGSGYGYEYLCATKNRSAGAPLIAVDCFSGTSSGWTMATCLARGCGAHSSAHGHSTRYVGYKRLTTTVNSNTLRSNYTTALGRYNESNYSAKYTSASRTALQTALTNAEGVLSDLNDGYTTTSQTNINSYATALSNAVSGLTLNTYTVTFKGYTSGTTTGNLKTQTVSYGGSASAPSVATTYDSSNHYTFKSWSGSYTNVTANQTVTATYNTVAHGYTSSVTANATCLSAGSTKYTCSCGYSYTSTTTPAKLNHSYTGAIRSDGNGKTATHSFKCVNGCDQYGGATTHTWNAGVVTSAPTCAGTGVKTYTCTVSGCGATYTETLRANGHTMQEIPAKAATCLAAGNNRYYKCTVCNKYYTTADGSTETTVAAQTVAQLPHSYTGEVRSNEDGTHSFKCVNGCGEFGGTVACEYEDVVTDPTCTAKGFTTHTCAVCGYSFTDSETDMTEHTYSVYVAEVTPATCEANAAATYKCENCDATTVKEVEGTKLPHSYTGEVRSNDDGTHSFKCVNGCEEFGGTVACEYENVVTDPTCTAKGFTTHTCAVCGYSFTDSETDMAEHTYSVYVEEVTPATCEANATATYKCENCDATIVKEVENTKLPHSYTGEVRSNEDGSHSFKCVNGCGEFGGTVECAYENTVIAPTCTAGGYTRHVCTVCGHSFIDSETDMTEHTYSVYVAEVTPATCEANATATYKCENCDATTVKEVENTQLPHSYTGEVRSNEDGTHSFKCVNGCGEFGGAVACAYDDVVTDPTCTAKGFTTHTCAVCGYSFTDSETDMTEHTYSVYVEEVAPATCEANATATYKCANCDATTVKEVENTQLSHSYTGEVRSNEDGTHSFKCVNGCGEFGGTVDCDYENTVIAPTCTAGGYTRHVCTVCGYSFTDGETEKIPHSFTNYVPDGNADCEHDGTKTAACDYGCGETKTVADEGSKVEHAWGAWSVTKSADCKEDGVEIRVCATCGTQEERPISSSTAAHSYGAWVETKAPSCTEKGTETRTCSVCGKSETRTINALGHAWGEWEDDPDAVATCTTGGEQHRVCERCGEEESRTIEGGIGHHVVYQNIRGEGYCEHCGEFRCSYCHDYDARMDIPVIGIFFQIVHFFIHLGHQISYDRSVFRVG